MSRINSGSKFLLFLGCIILLTRSSYAQKNPLIGVSPEDANFYKGLSSTNEIKCKDGSGKFNLFQFNDDFCDCADGSDEPGTSACPNGKFYCKNAGHSPLFIYSSRVNDGICDCCDGSDEYDGKKKCVNTCWEAGKVEREKLKKKIATYREGAKIRNQEIEQAKKALEKEEAQLSNLRNDERVLKPLVETLKERKEQIEKAEEKERLQKEKEERERKEAEKIETTTQASAEEHHESAGATEVNEVSTDGVPLYDETDTLREGFIQDEDKVEGIDSLSTNDHHEYTTGDELNEHSKDEELLYDGTDTLNEVSTENTEQLTKETGINEDAGHDTENQDVESVDNTNSLSREELGRRVASRWTGEISDKQKDPSDAYLSEDDVYPDGTPVEPNYEDDNGYDTEYDDKNEEPVNNFREYDQYDSNSPEEHESDDELDLSDITSKTSSSWLVKIQEKMKSVLSAINLLKTPVNVSEAASVRKEYDDASGKLSKLQSKISRLSEKLKQDFGPEKEFYSFYGQCFESKQNKYVYKVCPYKQASQVEGYSTTRLGNWEKFEDSYRTMKYENGDKCWNGPDRSMKVKLRCGLKNELTDVDEPSRCEYVALLSTPSLCLESRLKELEEKLELVHKTLPQGHDEL